MGPHGHFPISVLGFCLICSCAGLLHAVTVSYMYWSCCIWKKPYTWSHPQLLALTICTLPPSHGSLSLEGRSVIKTCHSGLSAPKFFQIPGFRLRNSICLQILLDTLFYYFLGIKVAMKVTLGANTHCITFIYLLYIHLPRDSARSHYRCL